MKRQIIFVSRSAKEGDPLTRRILMSIRRRPERLRSFLVVCRDSNLDGVAIKRLQRPFLRLIDFLNYFFLQSHSYLQKLRKQQDFVAISGCPATLSADLVLVNFSHRRYLSQVISSPDIDFREFVKLGRVLWSWLFEELLIRFGRAKLILCNSPGLTEEFRRRCNRGTQVEYLPNLIEIERFSNDTRLRYRDEARRNLKIKEGEFVFSFLSYGHFLRKGFFVAARALALVNQKLNADGEHPVKFLVVGGEGATIDRLKRRLQKIDRSYEDWILFSGACTQPEFLLSASDAFIFPSYFDSTPNAVIEAAGLSLPLFLTDFYGSELLLKNGVNGRLISHNVKSTAEIILDYLRCGERSRSTQIEFELNSEDSWAEDFFRYLDEVEEICH